MIIFLHGEDTYRSKKKVQEIISRYKKTHQSGLNLIFFDVKKSDHKEFSGQLKITPMFFEKKLIIIKNFFSKEDFQKYFLENIEGFLKGENIIVIYETEKIDKRNKAFKALSEKAKNQEFNLLENKELKKWAEKEINKLGGKIEEKAVYLLIDYIGNDLWRFSNEIKKVFSFKNKEIIKEKDVKETVRPRIDSDIFKTIESIARQDKKSALKLIDKHLEKGDSPLYILNMINFQFRNMLIVKDLTENCRPYSVILKKSGLHPFVVKKSYDQCGKFSLQELKKIYQDIFKIDFEVKTGKIDPRIALETLIAKI